MVKGCIIIYSYEMSKKKIELFIEIEHEKDFQQILDNNLDTLICAEIYNNFAGSCTALDRLFTKIKLDWSDGKMILLKVPADKINTLKRFWDQSEPVYMFIINNMVTKIFRGVDSIRFSEVAKQEIILFKQEQEEITFNRPMYALDEPTPEEVDWIKRRVMEKEEEERATIARREYRQAARKRHRAELMVPHLKFFNFVLYWPHMKRAHPELYERWALNNIIMVGREEVTLTKEKAIDILYAGDAPLNEASLHVLLSGPALAICFRLLDTDKHFVYGHYTYPIALVRKILYEEIPKYDELRLTDQPPQMTAFDLYKSYSLTKEEIWQQRREERTRLKEEAKEKKARRHSEMYRLACQAKLDAIEAKRAEIEQRKLELLKAGNLDALKKMEEEIYDDKEDFKIPEELSETSDEESDVENKEEYFPPPGLLIPGFYAPPSDIAKVNGLAILFPKLVLEYVTPQSEFLPPHVLVMLDVNKRYKALTVLAKHKSSIIHLGIFKATSPYNGVHIAHSVRQYDMIADQISVNSEKIKIVFMLSVITDVPLLELMDLNPIHVSRDTMAGEDECYAMFPVDYGDNYPEFEDFN